MNSEIENLDNLERAAAEKIHALTMAENDLILLLHNMKKVIGRQGVKAFLSDYLVSSGLDLKTSADRILLNLSTAEYLMRTGITYEDLKEIPISRWTQMRKYANINNYKLIKRYIMDGGTMQMLLASFKAGKKIYKNIFTDKIEWN